MGEVWLGFDLKKKVYWAIKIMKYTSEDSDVHKEQILREIEILKYTNHPGIPKFQDCILNDPYYYIVMEYIQGVTLYHKVEEEGKQKEDQVIKWGLRVCDILLYLHSMKPYPIIYRDLKPYNILVDEQDNIKIVDFGISCYQTASLSFYGPYLGTPGYASPEQRRAGILDIRSDIYNFGATLAFLLTGKTYDGSFSNEELEKLSKPCYECLKRCLMPRASRRYQTIHEVQKALYHILYYHRRKKLYVKRVLIFLAVMFLFIVSSFFCIKAYDRWKYLQQFKVAMQQEDYLSAIHYQSWNVEPYLLYYFQCLQSVFDVKEAIAYAIFEIERLNLHHIDNPAYLYYQIAQDCLMMNTIAYYEKAYIYLNKIISTDYSVKKEIETYIHITSLLKKSSFLSEDEWLELEKSLDILYQIAQKEQNNYKKIAHCRVLIELYMGKGEKFNDIGYKRVLEMISIISSLVDQEEIIRYKFSNIDLIYYEMLAYYFLGVYEQKQQEDGLALQYYHQMHLLFDTYQKEDTRNENLLIKMALSYLYQFEIDKDKTSLQ
ncbi:MAG: serine/threonine protein kinase, partial [Erysipelotrichaceae bacterium]|nr:serine/threonine protein kinase [Erysipelotrichaceae bacterium]